MEMKRREFLKLLAGSVWLSGFASQWPVKASAQEFDDKPNIILCMSDDQGWGDVGYNDHPILKTPNLDDMKASGLSFNRFYAAAPNCSPTRGSVLTGRHPNRFGCFTWGYSIRPQEFTLAEALKTAGYATGHFGKWHLGSVQWGALTNPEASGFDEWLSSPNAYDMNPILSREGNVIQVIGEGSMVTVDAALEFIARHAKSSQPFLAVIWFGAPHTPYKALPKDRQLYAGEDRKGYYGEITAMDRALGKLRQSLHELGIHQNTILWYCSDNGGLFEETSGGRGRKGAIYEGGLRVPAILQWPDRIPIPIESDVVCSTVDILPTLLEVAGVEVGNQPPVDGISLTPLMNQVLDRRPEPLGFWRYPAKGNQSAEDLMRSLLQQQSEQETNIHSYSADCLTSPTVHRVEAIPVKQYLEDIFPGHAAWLDWPWKLHRIEGYTNHEGWLSWPWNPSPKQLEAIEVKLELYNLSTDPNEENNLIARESERADVMRTELETWQKSVVRSLNGEDYS